MTSRIELDLIYNDLAPLADRITNPALEIRRITTNFLLKVSHLGPDWLHQSIPVLMRNSETLKPQTLKIRMMDALAGIYLLTRSMQAADPENPAFQVLDESNASLVVGAASDFILEAGVFFGDGTENIISLGEQKVLDEIGVIIAEQDNHALIEVGTGALAMALIDPLHKDVPNFSGVSAAIQSLTPIEKQMIIQHLSLKALQNSEQITPHNLTTQDYMRWAKGGGHPQLRRHYGRIVNSVQKLLQPVQKYT